MFCDIIFNVYQSIQWALFKLYGDFLKRIGYLQKQYFQQTPKLTTCYWFYLSLLLCSVTEYLFIFLIFLFVEIHVYVVL